MTVWLATHDAALPFRERPPRVEQVEVSQALIDGTQELRIELVGGSVPCEAGRQIGSLFPGDPRYTPSLRQLELVEAGFLGRKSGRGFYRYDHGSAPPVPATALPQVEGGSVVALAVTSAERLPALPAVPTMIEAGYAKFNFVLWHGLYAPAGTPKDAVALLEREVQAVLAEPDVVKRFLDLALQARPTSAAALGQRMASEIERWTNPVPDIRAFDQPAVSRS